MSASRSTQRPPAKQRRPASATLAFAGVLFEVWQWNQPLADGSSRVFETIRRPDTVLVLPVTDDGQVLLAEESQPAMPTVLHAVGGRVEAGESPEAAAQRELREETGYSAGELRLWDAWQPVNKLDWAIYLFVAHRLTRHPPAAPDAGEQIVVRSFPVSLLLGRNSALAVDDYELQHKLNFALSDDEEYARVINLLSPPK